MKTYLSGRWASIQYAWQGCIFLLRREMNFKIHAVAAIIIFLFAWVTGINPAEWALLLLTVAAVGSLEAINTAIEKIADIVNPEWDHKIKVIKDISAAAVFIMSLAAIGIAAFIFIPKWY